MLENCCMKCQYHPTHPKKERIFFFVLGQLLTASTLSQVSGLLPCPLTLGVRPASRTLLRTQDLEVTVPGVAVDDEIIQLHQSSQYWRIWSISRWNVPGAPCNPSAIVVNCKRPMGVLIAVFSLNFLSSRTWQTPLQRSNTVMYLALPILYSGQWTNIKLRDSIEFSEV